MSAKRAGNAGRQRASTSTALPAATSMSVVVNTLNRAEYLADCLTSLERQTYRDYEIIVVKGPCTDDTPEVLNQFAGSIRVVHCDEINLSVSRNLGVAAAAGDVCAFIDDDAVAHPQWLSHLARAYDDPQVSGAGGFTLDNNGFDFQCRYTVCDRLANAWLLNHVNPGGLMKCPELVLYPSLLGTNSTFRRSSLEAIGGFDEVFAYMYDETDVCLRLFDRGELIVAVPKALVIHRYAHSHTRDQKRRPRSLLVPARSKAYFCHKHARDRAQTVQVSEELARFRAELRKSNHWLLAAGEITAAQFVRLDGEVDAGLLEGTSLALAAAGKAGQLRSRATASDVPRPPAVAIRSSRTDRLRVCLVSQGYPPQDIGGIARWTETLARALVRQGHEVHVICRAQAEPVLSYHAGVWLHAIRDDATARPVPDMPVTVPASAYARAAAVFTEVCRTRDVWGLDIVMAPIWDVEGLLCVGQVGLPVATSLHTTYKLALPYKEDWHGNPAYMAGHVDQIVRAETWMLRHSDLIVANSYAIVNAIEPSYDLTLPPGRLAFVPHGLAPLENDTRRPAHEQSEPLRLLYVGRIERRKGLDILLCALVPLLSAANITLDVVGAEVTAEQNYAATIAGYRASFEGLGIVGQIRFHGHVDDDTREAHYRACHVVVVPSRFESFGLTAIEAMRHGKPVVAAAVGGLVEVIESGSDGLLYPAEDAIELRRLLMRLAFDPALVARLGDAALARFAGAFTDALMANEIVAAFRSKLTSSPPANRH